MTMRERHGMGRLLCRGDQDPNLQNVYFSHLYHGCASSFIHTAIALPTPPYAVQPYDGCGALYYLLRLNTVLKSKLYG